MTDWQLLQQYVQTRSEDAFGELARRHSPWIRSAARRQVGDAHLADDVTQAALLALAQQAHRVHQGAALSTWLFQVTRYAAAAALRAQARRKRHERSAAAMMPVSEETNMTAGQWEELAPMLEGLVARLGGDDQRAVLLRFYEQKSYPDIAGVLGVSEEAARKRTDRAVGRLREMIARRDIVLSAEALAAGMLAHVASAEALAATTTPPARVTAISKGALQMMTFAKMKIPAAVAIFVLVLGVAAITFSRAGSSPVPPPRAASTIAPSTAPATSAPDETTPRGVILAAFRAASAGDADGLIRRFDRVTPQQEATMRQVAELMSAAHDLLTAIEENVPGRLDPQLSRMLGTGVMDADVAFAPEAIEGDRALVDLAAGPGKIALTKSGATWKIAPDVMRTLNPRMVSQWAARTPALKQLTGDIRGGKYKDVTELQQAMQAMMANPPSTRPATAPAQPARLSR